MAGGEDRPCGRGRGGCGRAPHGSNAGGATARWPCERGRHVAGEEGVTYGGRAVGCYFFKKKKNNDDYSYKYGTKIR